MDYSYSEIVPQDIQDALIALRDHISVDSWALGDLAEAEINYVRANHLDVSRDFTYKAVGSFAGKAARTVREYHQIAREYEPWLRERYAVLSFDHFRTASRLGYYEVALDWAVSQVDELNRPATVDAMEVNFKESRKTFEEEQTQELSPAEVYVLTLLDDLKWAQEHLPDMIGVLNADEIQEASTALAYLVQIFSPYVAEMQAPANAPLTTVPAGV